MRYERVHAPALIWAICQKGVAAVEFALLLPVLLSMLMGSYELSRYIVLNQRISNVSYTVADVLAQTTEPTSSLVTDVLSASAKIMSPFTFESNGTVYANYVCGDSAGNAVLQLQYQGAGTLDRASQLGEQGEYVDLPGEIELASGDCVVVSEVFYIYTPVITDKFIDSEENYRSSVFKLRYGTLATLQ